MQVKFNVTRNENHIIQAIATVDFQDKGVNGFFMRLHTAAINFNRIFIQEVQGRPTTEQMVAAAVVAIYAIMPATVTRYDSIRIQATPDITDGSPESIIHMKSNAFFETPTPKLGEEVAGEVKFKITRPEDKRILPML
ncbi:hypothetical protein ACHAPV_004757 [Trichoderma viride]